MRIANVIIVLSLLLISAICSAEGYNLLDMYQKPGNEGKTIPQVDYRPLYGKYPLVGSDNATTYYLDTSSCTAYQEGEKYVIACIVYSANGGYPPKVKQSTYKFSTQKLEDNFMVKLESVNSSVNEAQQILQRDNGYLRFLFLQAALYSQYPAAKIQALNQEAEAQLKAEADIKEAEYQRQQEEKRAREAAAASQSQPQYQSDDGYIGNANSGKFHHSYCQSVKRMNPANKVYIGSREEAISRGYEPCKRCRP